MALQALELTLDPPGDAWVRQRWGSLARVGLPSQARHRGPSNAPHVTLVAAPAITPDQASAAAEALAPLLPAALATAGLVVFGARRLTLALLITPPPMLRDVVQAQRETILPVGGHEWVAHVSLARGLTPQQLGQAVDTLAGDGTRPALTAVGLRHWDPQTSTIRPLE